MHYMQQMRIFWNFFVNFFCFIYELQSLNFTVVVSGLIVIFPKYRAIINWRLNSKLIRHANCRDCFACYIKVYHRLNGSSSPVLKTFLGNGCPSLTPSFEGNPFTQRHENFVTKHQSPGEDFVILACTFLIELQSVMDIQTDGWTPRPWLRRVKHFAVAHKRHLILFWSDLNAAEATDVRGKASSAGVNGGTTGTVQKSKCCSTNGCYTNDVDEQQQLWLGDPEAISSVRRARKPLTQRRVKSAFYKQSAYTPCLNLVSATKFTALSLFQFLSADSLSYRFVLYTCISFSQVCLFFVCWSLRLKACYKC